MLHTGYWPLLFDYGTARFQRNVEYLKSYSPVHKCEKRCLLSFYDDYTSDHDDREVPVLLLNSGQN